MYLKSKTCRSFELLNTIHLICVDGPDNPVLNTTGTLNVTEYNSTPHITCQSSCNPQCDYKFSKDGSTRSFRSLGIFYKSSVRRNDDGIYRCIATNKVGNRTSSGSFRLNVLCKFPLYFCPCFLNHICMYNFYVHVIQYIYMYFEQSNLNKTCISAYIRYMYV